MQATEQSPRPNGDAQNRPPKPKQPGPNNPFREALLSFNRQRVIVITDQGEIHGKFHCFDLGGSRCIAIDVDDQGPTILSHYKSVRLETPDKAK